MSTSMTSPAARRPSKLTYNDLNGDECASILTDWFTQLLRSHPLLQKHVTLPNVLMTLQVKVGFDMHIGGTVPVQSPPESLELTGQVRLEHELSEALADLRNETSLRLAAELEADELEHQRELEAVVNAAPIPGGKPPDQIRLTHGLPVPRPAYGGRETGSHMFLADVLEGAPDTRKTLTDPIIHPPNPAIDNSITGGRRGEVAEGYVFASEVITVSPTEQHMPADNGGIDIELAGRGIRHDSGMVVKAPEHRASVKVLGDAKGESYGGVNGVYDPGPRGLMSPSRGGGGYGTDGRPRLSFGNSHRNSG